MKYFLLIISIDTKTLYDNVTINDVLNGIFVCRNYS